MKRSLTPVLVVDDEDTTRTVIKRGLEALGIDELDMASDGSDALFMLQARQYGLVISDWHMKMMGGLQLLRDMRKDPRTAHVPFIMITADAQVEIVLQARQAGADSVILKPFDMQVLRTKIVDVVKQKPNYARPTLPNAEFQPRLVVAS